ncbi:hypothetical protein [Candidatus Symbiothrix dinenymphae]|uniref:hypothetical protein n=1 Tax=Candidatus Symbiothrix dinenymphae TaxID=467085 RepID=UPI0006E2263A|nr:hypothetical protein [Candidatus Symbiothrix dinenymphae]GHT52193.1 hypothetical protein AGMMS49982_11790 [Bacteroidia bacterium]
MLKEILSIDLNNHEIVVCSNLSEKEKLKMTNVNLELLSEVYFVKDNPSLVAIVFLTCNIDDICHYGIAVKESNNVKWCLIKSSDFNNNFIK